MFPQSDYSRSILSIPASIQTHYGVQSRHTPLPLLMDYLATSYQNIVVMLFDGMGMDALSRHLPADAFLRRHVRDTLSSVFPATTTAATVTLETGLSPIEHGWLGWSLYFPEIDTNVNIFPNTLSGSNDVKAAEYSLAWRYMPQDTLYQRIQRETGGAVQALSISAFGMHHIEDLPSLYDAVRAHCAKPGRKYLYAYWHQPDYDMHEYGVGDARVGAFIRRCDRDMEALCQCLRDTLVIVTADHGLLDTQWHTLKSAPDVADCLVRPPSFEARAMNFFVKPGCKQAFVRGFRDAFDREYLLLDRDAVLRHALFGPGDPHPRIHTLLGDYLAIATGPVSIDSGGMPQFKAVHAGITPAEVAVPLIVVPCG